MDEALELLAAGEEIREILGGCFISIDVTISRNGNRSYSMYCQPSQLTIEDVALLLRMKGYEPEFINTMECDNAIWADYKVKMKGQESSDGFEFKLSCVVTSLPAYDADEFADDEHLAGIYSASC